MIPAHIRTIAEEALTAKQFEAFELTENYGWSMDRIGRYLGIRKQSVASRLEGADLRMERAGVRQDANGDWYVEEIFTGEVIMEDVRYADEEDAA